MNQTIGELDIVALVRDIPADGLVAGQTGTVMLVHNQGEAFEVEFPLGGYRFSVVTVEREHLLKLHYPQKSKALEPNKA